ncbi:MAG: hypothetical protein WD342_21390 [Verrucomicrobiales bacterium]
MRLAPTIAGLLSLSLPSVVLADGYPFHHDTHEVIGDSLQLALSDEQVTEVSSKGLLTFSQEQHTLLKKFYANSPAKIRVVSSTFNDGLDVRDPNPVDCIWTSPSYVGITLREKYDEGDYTFETEADPWPILRISPEGDIYSRGVKITKEAAFDLIRAAKKAEGIDEPPYIAVTLPPPYREPRKTESNDAVTKLFSELEEIGNASSVVVHRCW